MGLCLGYSKRNNKNMGPGEQEEKGTQNNQRNQVKRAVIQQDREGP